ncbi:hypothetical protein LOTGIDRAFT_160260 [Lottia gigantea]|uniref:Set apart in position or space protein n=1 Tax=Lottia gigantea TaxID=225164 RepID=V3ZW14_LOTGI|nr:hypothetical protein LOTGIDRAFT_160260 [Lottia gigantea]ESO95708.1 hypothetical protein LOTGIDRAFT_160260 [Lottia gigantea]
MIPKSHKTVFVLDHGPVFSKSSQEPLDYDVISKSKTPGVIPAAPIFKSLWTWGIECVLEYMRIIFDVFPADHLIQLVSGNSCLNNWNQKEQSIQHLMSSLSHLGPPKSDSLEDEYSAMHGLSLAIESLCRQSELQTTLIEQDESVVKNNGRIVCLTNLKSEAHIRMLEECVLDAVTRHNKLAGSKDGGIINLIKILAEFGKCFMALGPGGLRCLDQTLLQ